MPKRRRGYQPPRPHRSALPTRHRSFEALVERALASIPMPFARALDEVAIVIADEPTREELRENGLDEEDALYGLYEGTPRTEWGADWVPMPNRITLYRLPLEEDFPDPRDLAEEVRETVIHELAHHLGIDDERLGELGHD
jgi:predicted Zn-dependent protease with MMP-like domain